MKRRGDEVAVLWNAGGEAHGAVIDAGRGGVAPGGRREPLGVPTTQYIIPHA